MPDRLVVVEHEDNATLDLMAAPLADSWTGPIEVLRPYRGDVLPQDTSGIGALLVLGGEMGALDDVAAPWLPGTRRLLAQAVAGQVPTLGICLGAQLLAAATGGVVERGAGGLELGLVSLRPLPWAGADPYLGHVLGRLGGQLGDVLQYHRDAVTTLPPDAELLVSGEQYPHQAFRVGAAAWGVQYHPEVSATAFESWLGAAEVEDPPASAAARAAIHARPGVAGRPDLARAHATGLVAAITLVP